MSSSESINGGGGGEDPELGDAHVVELVASSTPDSSSDLISEEQIIPLLAPTEKPKINIFSVSYPRRKTNREQVIRSSEIETSPFTQFFMWAWSGSRYSGLLCMALSSTIYCIMEMYSHLDFIIYVAEEEWTTDVWDNKCQESFGFKSSHRIPLIVEFCLLHSKVTTLSGYHIELYNSNYGIPCSKSYLAGKVENRRNRSFFGVLFIFRPMLTTQGWLAKAAETSDSYVHGSYHIYAVLVGLFSSITGGISYCLTRAGAKASDQPVVTVFSFGVLASPASIICTFAFEDFVLPSLYSFFLMIALGILAFFAEARGLQLEKTSKVSNIQYIEAALTQLWGMGSSRIFPSFGRLVGCLLILISACCTMYIGPDKDFE
ncbi:hypothetical protein HYC85_014443 [Camellia sinensis]|uniref:EamA domain-containing protein n=1 Tax=Camellia sinensis TaxID=4442 RepID=A0A7J7H9P6_CAMSI|nr:hypothetical protein HYC85_014443 [Camellia sinensis]